MRLDATPREKGAMRSAADSTSIKNASPKPGACAPYHWTAWSSSISAISRSRTVTAGIWQRRRSGLWRQARRADRQPHGRSPRVPTVDRCRDRHGRGCRARPQPGRCGLPAAALVPARSASWPRRSSRLLAVQDLKIAVRPLRLKERVLRTARFHLFRVRAHWRCLFHKAQSVHPLLTGRTMLQLLRQLLAGLLAGAVASTPEPLAGDGRAIAHRLELGPHHVLGHLGVADDRAEAAIGSGHDALAVADGAH